MEENTTADEIISNDENTPRTPRPIVDVTDEHLASAVEVLAQIIGYIGLSAKVSAQNYNNRILLSVNSPDAGRIIGRKGQTLEAIQFLLARVLMKGENDFPRISIDIDGYARQGGGTREEGRPLEGEGRSEQRQERRPRNNDRRREDRSEQRTERPERRREDREGISFEREETLKQQAQDYAKEVLKWGEPMTLPPMNSMERRIIHVALQDNTEVKTESIGEGSRKSVVISQR